MLIRGREKQMEAAKKVGYAVLAALVVGVCLNFRDIRRYIHMSRM
jgi:hypothetical protein